MLLLSIYVLYSNVTYISCIMSCGIKIVSKLFQIVSNCLNCFKIELDCVPMWYHIAVFRVKPCTTGRQEVEFLGWHQSADLE